MTGFYPADLNLNGYFPLEQKKHIVFRAIRENIGNKKSQRSNPLLSQPYKTAVKIIWSDSNLWLRAHPWLEERPPLVVEHFSPFNESAMTQLLRGN